MSAEPTYEDLLLEVIEMVEESNRQMKPGMPMAELRSAIEEAIGALPALEFQEFTEALNDADAAGRLVQRAPEIIGWNADQIVAWIEELSKKL